MVINKFEQYRKEALGPMLKTDCYRKVGKAISIWGAVEKNPILLSQYWNNKQFL